MSGLGSAPPAAPAYVAAPRADRDLGLAQGRPRPLVRRRRVRVVKLAAAVLSPLDTKRLLLTTTVDEPAQHLGARLLPLGCHVIFDIGPEVSKEAPGCTF